MTTLTPTPHSTLLGYIRTYVPYAVSSFFALLLLKYSIDVSDELQLASIAFTVAAATNIYYLLIRLLEPHAPWLGWLLGWPARPEYLGLSDLWGSVIRTLIPSLVAFLLAVAVDLGSRLLGTPIAIDQVATAVALVAIVEALYYAAARWLLTRWPGLKFLLGTGTAPVYSV